MFSIKLLLFFQLCVLYKYISGKEIASQFRDRRFKPLHTYDFNFLALSLTVNKNLQISAYQSLQRTQKSKTPALGLRVWPKSAPKKRPLPSNETYNKLMIKYKMIKKTSANKYPISQKQRLVEINTEEH